MTAIERLQSGQGHVAAGRYEEALDEFIWFHENALAERPALCGVRLSFALAYWMDLGNRYPKALTALEEIRDGKTAALLRGELTVDAFRDVAAINEYLGSSSPTYRLYLQLAELQPELATACARAALPSIVNAKDYPLAARLAPDSEASIRRDGASLNRDVRMIRHRPYTKAPVRWACVCIYVESVQRLLAIVGGNGDHAEATRLKALAIGLIESPSLRREVTSEFVKPTRPSRPKF